MTRDRATSATGRRRRLAAMRAAVLALAVGALAAGVAVTGVQSASAHDYLVSTSPAADSTFTDELTSVSLTFNEPPLADASAAIAIELHDPSGANVATGPVSIVNATLSIPVAPTTQGAYTVLWQNVSADGHAVSGEFAFEYAGPVPASSPPATAGEGIGSSASAAPSPSPSATPTVAGTPPATATAAGSGAGIRFPLVVVGLVTALTVIVVVAVALVVLVRRRRSAG